LYDQELTYTIDNPYDSALFLLRMVRIEGQERGNQMTTGLIQSELISDFRSFASGQTWRICWQLLQVQMKILEGYEAEPRVASPDLKIDDRGKKTSINDKA
jgi:hypothetical protein